MDISNDYWSNNAVNTKLHENSLKLTKIFPWEKRNTRSVDTFFLYPTIQKKISS